MARSNGAEGADHLHHHATRGRGGVDRLGERAEARAGGLDALEDVQKVLERARQAIEMGYSGIRRPEVG